MNEIYLHIGLHKTATKFFQHRLFPKLGDDFLYNPETLSQYLLDYLKAFPEDRIHCIENLNAELGRLENDFPSKKILISREIMSGDLFTAYKYWDENVAKLKTCFPTAKLLMGMRFQPNWLASCYRESLHEHHYQTIEKFLNYSADTKSFLNPSSDRNDKGYANLYALNLDYSRMLDVLFDSFDKETVYLYFFEDFKKNKIQMAQDFLSFIGSEPFEPIDNQSIPNRGYSGFSINLSKMRYKILSAIGLKFLIHRPIFFFGEKSIPAGNVDISILDKEKYWGSWLLRDNEELRVATWPKIRFLDKIKREFTWRNFIKQRVDKGFYWDWDILADMRPPLESYYRKNNQGLLKYLPKEKIPNLYLED